MSHLRRASPRGRLTAFPLSWPPWPRPNVQGLAAHRLVGQLIAAGHTPSAAEGWAEGCTAWSTADPRAIDAFAKADARMWQAFSEHRPEEAWIRAMADANQQWITRRGL